MWVTLTSDSPLLDATPLFMAMVRSMMQKPVSLDTGSTPRVTPYQAVYRRLGSVIVGRSLVSAINVHVLALALSLHRPFLHSAIGALLWLMLGDLDPQRPPCWLRYVPLVDS